MEFNGGVPRGERRVRGHAPARSSSSGFWARLHRAAARQALGLDDSHCLAAEIDAVIESMSCLYCKRHTLSFLEKKRNKFWLLHDPEFLVYKLHTAANANARRAGHRSSFPPPYEAAIKKFRSEVSRERG